MNKKNLIKVKARENFISKIKHQAFFLCVFFIVNAACSSIYQPRLVFYTYIKDGKYYGLNQCCHASWLKTKNQKNFNQSVYPSDNIYYVGIHVGHFMPRAVYSARCTCA